MLFVESISRSKRESRPREIKTKKDIDLIVGGKNEKTEEHVRSKLRPKQDKTTYLFKTDDYE